MHIEARTRASNRWTRVGTIARHGCSIGAQVYCRPHNVNLPTRPFRFPCHYVDVHYLRVPGDGPAWLGWLVLAVQWVPHVRCGPHDAHLTTQPVHFTLSNLGTRHSRGAKIWHLPHNDLVIGLGDASSHNGDPKPVHKMEIQGRFTQWRSEANAGSHNGDPIPVHTREIRSRFTHWRCKAGSHTGDPN